MLPRGSAENVKLDVKGSQTGAAPGVATAAPPRPAAAHAPGGPGLSGARSTSRGPAGSCYSNCCQAYHKVSTNPMFGCAGLGVLGSADLFPRRFEGSLSEERFGSRTRTYSCVKLDGKRCRQDGSLLDSGGGPRPNTARPEGGCVTIRHHYQCLLPSWLKRPMRDESIRLHKYSLPLCVRLRPKGNKKKTTSPSTTSTRAWSPQPIGAV